MLTKEAIMGWAKYLEDDMSIYVGRLAMHGDARIHYIETNQHPIREKLDIIIEPPEEESSIVGHATRSGRRGLELRFQKGLEEKRIQKLRMNGWWWSKTNACWCNLDTNGNRKYAVGLFNTGAKMMVVS